MRRQAPREPWLAWRDSAILQEQVTLLRRNFSPTLITSLAAALGSVWALYTLAKPSALWWWFASHALVMGSAYWVQRWWLHKDRAATDNAWAVVACMGAMGLSWGSLSWVCVAYGQPLALVYTIMFISGACSGALGLGGPLFPAYLSFLIQPVAMIMMALAYVGGPLFLPLLAIVSTYFALTFVQARNAELGALNSILLQFENTALMLRLRDESAQAVQAKQEAEEAQQLAQASQLLAEKANTDKSKFLAAASHDLRQPLHAMGLFIEALSRSDMTPQQISVLNHAHAASNAASEMLTTLLDFSRLEAGVVQSMPRAFSLQTMLVKLEQEFGMQADVQELVYRTRDTTLAAFADPNLTDLILRNFISNALRYTDKGGILVSCRARGGAVVVEVWDTGIGISSSQQTEVFTEFHQLGNPERDRRKGLGLGLAIVQRISAAMDAKVTLRSRPGHGSVFRLWLQGYQGPVVQDLPLAAQSKNLRGLRVLVIDDEEPVRLGMQELLDSWGCQCCTAQDLAGALKYVALQPLQALPEVILADYRLREGANGGQAIEALRAYMLLRGHEAHLPAIIITGDTAPERLREARSTGAAVLHKPVSASALQQALVQLR